SILIKILSILFICCFFFFTGPSTSGSYPLSLHDALPISRLSRRDEHSLAGGGNCRRRHRWPCRWFGPFRGPLNHRERRRRRSHRSEEHTSELQSRGHRVCRLLLEKKEKGLSMDELSDTRK